MNATWRYRRDMARWLVAQTGSLVRLLTAAVVARVVGKLAGVALAVVAATAVVQAGQGEPVSGGSIAAWLVGIALVKALLRYLEHYTGHWVAFAALERLRAVFFAALVPQAPAATQGKAGAELTERATSDIDRIEAFFAHMAPPAIGAVVVPGVALTWLGLAVDPLAAAVLAPCVVVTLVIPVLASGRTWRAARAVADGRAALATSVGDDIQGTREVLAFGAQAARLAQLRDLDTALARARAVVGRIQALRVGATVAVNAIGLIAVVAVTSGRASDTVAVAAAVAVAVSLWGSAGDIDDFATSLDAAFAATERVRAVVEAPVIVRQPAQPQPLPAARAVQFEQVSLTYPGASTPALAQVSGQCRADEWNYLVGVSGSGKSTLASLVLRGRDVDAGAVLIGGVDVRALDLTQLRAGIGFVSQRPTMLAVSIGENLRLAAPGAKDEALLAALAQVDLDGWLATLPHGLATPIRERGLGVSGGQLQRLALARALVADPAILVLDEALSQLDEVTAARVRTRVRAARAQRTVIEVTHRVDLIDDEAHVLVLDGGRLVESGRAGQLRRRAGAFRELQARA